MAAVSGFRDFLAVPFPSFESVNLWRAAAADLVRAVRSGTPTACDATDGMRALEIGVAMHASHAGGNCLITPGEIDPDLRILNR